jgi:hypothetical protein
MPTDHRKRDGGPNSRGGLRLEPPSAERPGRGVIEHPTGSALSHQCARDWAGGGIDCHEHDVAARDRRD